MIGLSDYGDMLARNPEDRPPGTLVGLGRASKHKALLFFILATLCGSSI
jgi:hypothetical protein